MDRPSVGGGAATNDMIPTGALEHHRVTKVPEGASGLYLSTLLGHYSTLCKQ